MNAAAALFNGSNGQPLGDLLDYHARRDAKRVALIVEDKSVSYAELDASANRRARVLASKGVTVGDFVTVALPNSLEFYETAFAIWKLGAVPNIVSPNLTEHEMGVIVGLVDPRLLIGFEPAASMGRVSLGANLGVDGMLSAEPHPRAVSPHWKAMTSGGSTGTPKVILDSMPGLWDPNSPVLGQRSEDTILNPGPLYHNAPFLGMNYGLFIGATIVEMLRFDAQTVLEFVDRYKVNWLNLVPTMMHRIWRLDRQVRDRYDVSSLRLLFHMAAPCPDWLKEAWIKWLGAERVLELYSATERQGSTLITGTEWLAHKGSVGKPQPGAKICILNDNGEVCAPGEIGEIFFLPDAGQGSTYRYIGSEPKQFGQWESLGDLGHFDSDGYLYLSDRRTDLILSGGSNIYPAEVEAVLEEHRSVQSCIVIGLPDEEWGQRVHAIVQCDPAHMPSEDELLSFAAKKLVRYKLPRSIEFTASNLRDDAGKARRKLLLAARI